jgi:hypothetical protein
MYRSYPGIVTLNIVEITEFRRGCKNCHKQFAQTLPDGTSIIHEAALPGLQVDDEELTDTKSLRDYAVLKNPAGVR